MLIAARIAFALAAVFIWLWTQELLRGRAVADPGQIGDWVHRRTARINAFLNSSRRAADSLLISSSLVIDGLGLFILLTGVFGGSIRPLLALVLLFSLRQLNQFVTSLPAPPGMIWRDPGVPSLFVTYGVSNDLFFSGHTALACLGTMELARTGNAGLALLALAFEVAVVLVLRAHWTMDVFTGAITALWVSGAAARLSPSLDAWLSRVF